MNFSPVFVFRTPFYEPRYQEFYNVTHLKEFLTEFNFMAPHAVSNLSTGLPEFQLGTKLEFILDGYYCESDIRWGPRFIAARSIRIDNASGRVYADVPMDSHSRNGGRIVNREYREILLHRGITDAVINMHNLRQLLPVCEENRSELNKFLSIVMREKYQIKRR